MATVFDSTSSSTSVGRLIFDETSERVFGRVEEIQDLRNAILQRGDIDNGNSNIILLHGTSGSGKSALCREVGKEFPYFVSGKFDQLQKSPSTPLPALIHALDQLGGLLRESMSEYSEEERKIIHRSLEDEGSLLSAVSPNLSSLLQDPTNAGTENLVMMSERLVLAIRSFLKRIDALKEKIVIFLDDIQWADKSLQLLLSISDDVLDLEHVVLIFAHRTNLDEEHQFFTEHLKDRSREVEIRDLSEEKCNNMVAGMLAMNTEETESLAKEVHHKTFGNPMAIIQFMKLLEQWEYLVFSFVEMRWTWKSEEIRMRTQVMNNVVDMLTARVQRLPRNIVRILSLASCTGFAFEEELLETMYEMEIIDALEEVLPQQSLSRHALQSTGESSKEINAAKEEESQNEAQDGSGDDMITFQMALKVAEQEGMLVRVSESEKKWRFSHDRVQECIYNMLPVGKARERLHFTLGNHFQQVYGNADNPRYTFLTVDQMNRATSFLENKPKDRLQLIRLNLQAAQAAKKMNGTELVARYSGMAVELCREEDWLDMPQVLLEVHKTSAEAEFALGHFEQVSENALVVSMKGRSIEETITTRLLFMETLGAQRRFQEALVEGRKILLALGQPLPEATKANVAKELKLATKLTRGKDDDFFRQLPIMTNQKLVWTMQVLKSCSVFGWNSDEGEALLIFHRMLNLTITKGRSSMTSWAFASCCSLGAIAVDDKSAFRFSEIASAEISEKSQIPSAYIMIFSFGSHLGMPVSAALEPSLSGYRLGLEYGDVFSGAICMALYTCAYNVCGLALPSFLSDMKKFGHHLKLLKQELALSFLLVFYQMGMHLTEKSDFATSWEALRSDPLYVASAEIDPESQATILMLQMRLFNDLVVEDIDHAAKTLDVLKGKRQRRLSGPHIMNYMFAFSEGLLCTALIRKRKGSRFIRKTLKENMAWLKARVKGGNMNCVGMLQLLLAEDSPKKPGDETRRQMYDTAICSFVRSGFMHYGAMANELAGRFMAEAKDDYWSQHYLGEAANLYSRWGATRKVNMMIREFDFLDKDNLAAVLASSRMSALKGRERFDPKTDGSSSDNGVVLGLTRGVSG